jgi:predicted permease
LLRSTGPADLPRLDALALSPTAVLVALLLALATGTLAGLIASRAAVRGAVAQALVEAHARGTEGPLAARRRRALVVSQLAIAMGLLACALPMLRSVRALEAVDPGFETGGVFSARVATVRAKYPDAAKQSAFFERLLDEARAIPGVESAAAVLMRPLSGEIGWDYRFQVEGQTEEEAKANPYSNFEAVSDGYFATMRMPLVRGREFTRDDDAGAPPVVVVGESLARRFWPGEDALGKRVKLNSRPEAPFATVVGVAPDGRYRDWRGVRMDLYAPFRQQTEYRMDFVLRSPRETAELARDFRAAVARIDPEIAVSGVTSMDAAVDAALARPRFDGALLAAFALLAATLAAAGVFSVALFTVEQRRVELGVRRALGASAREIARGVLARALADAAIAIGLGVVLAIPAWRVLRGLLFGVAPHDPGSLAGSALLLAAAVVVASAIPAWRASRVAPAEALRHA